jgi:hypothetical protein
MHEKVNGGGRTGAIVLYAEDVHGELLGSYSVAVGRIGDDGYVHALAPARPKLTGL